tara:strand:+ start:100 stop:510 length:411 start_codon:yes stop_codon:yes gene_type:complete
MKYWLVKSEPSTWSWKNQKKEKITMWDGVRNYQARNNLMAMKKKDLCFFYHSVKEKQIMGIVVVEREYYPDPTDKLKRFVAVDLKYKSSFKRPVTLEEMKNDIKLKNLILLKQSRLSVMPIEKKLWDHICKLGQLI